METSYHENYIRQLQRLLHTVTKSRYKYSQASEQIESQELKTLFNRYANERNDIINELKDAIKRLGAQENGSTEPDTSLPDLNSTEIRTKKDQSIMETLRGSEQGTLDTYDDILQGSILEDFNLKTLIMGQRLLINEAFTELDRRYFELFKLSQPY